MHQGEPEDKKKQVNNFNKKLEDLLNDDNFQLDSNGEFDSMYLEDIKATHYSTPV